MTEQWLVMMGKEGWVTHFRREVKGSGKVITVPAGTTLGVDYFAGWGDTLEAAYADALRVAQEAK